MRDININPSCPPTDKSVYALARNLPLRMTLGLLALVSVAFIAAACGSTDEALEERWERLEVPEPEIMFLGEFTDQERAAITREVKSVQVSFAERFDVVTSEFTLYISTEFEALNDAYQGWLPLDYRRRGFELPSWFRCAGFARPEAIFIALETCDEEQRAHGGPIAHEYFHILQYHLGLVGGSRTWTKSLMEGAAVYASAQHAEEQGRSTVEWRRKVARLEWSSLGICLPGLGFCDKNGNILQTDLTGLVDTVLRYEVGFLAVDWLVERKGERALMEFFRLGGGVHEFEEAFGMTPEEFADGLEGLWRDVAPPFEWQLSASVLDPNGQPVPYVQVEIIMEVEGERVFLLGNRADAMGKFKVYGPDESHTLGVFLKCPDGSPVYWAFVGEWGAGGFVADTDGRFDSEDEAAEPVAGGRNRAGIVIKLPETRKVLVERYCEP